MTTKITIKIATIGDSKPNPVSCNMAISQGRFLRTFTGATRSIRKNLSLFENFTQNLYGSLFLLEDLTQNSYKYLFSRFVGAEEILSESLNLPLCPISNVKRATNEPRI